MPVKAQAGVDIAASEREVWTVLADIASWPTWNPAIRYETCNDQLELSVGTRFRFATELGTLRCRITKVDAPHLLAWKGRVLIFGERQVWRLAANENGTRVDVEAEMTGLGSRLFQRRLDARLQRVMDAVVQLIRLEAEARSAEQLEDAARASRDETRKHTDG